MSPSPAALRRYAGAVACALVLCGFTPQAHAALVLNAGNVPGVDQQNVLFTANAFGVMVVGETNQTGDDVSFTSSGQFLLGQANGQATINAKAINNAGSSDVLVSAPITIAPVDSTQAFGGVIFNLANTGLPRGTGTVQLNVATLDMSNTPMNVVLVVTVDSDPISIGNGSNFYSLFATAGMRITSLTIAPTVGSSYVALQQVRVSMANAVPEPAGAVAALAALLTAGIRGRRR
jgi:hypothetical protein